MALAEYRPRFVLWTSFFAQLPLQLFIAFWAGGFFGGLITSFFPAAADRVIDRLMYPFVAVGFGTFFLLSVGTLIVKSLNYANTVYRIHPDRIEIEEGFFTRHRKELAFCSVREINLRRGILQRLVGLGSVYIATAATGQGQWWQSSAIIGATSTFGSGAMLMDLANSETIYQQLRRLVEGQPHGPGESR
jgi:membrane protein YdbS with pleckstrin-like domain